MKPAAATCRKIAIVFLAAIMSFSLALTYVQTPLSAFAETDHPETASTQETSEANVALLQMAASAAEEAATVDGLPAATESGAEAEPEDEASNGTDPTGTPDEPEGETEEATETDSPSDPDAKQQTDEEATATLAPLSAEKTEVASANGAYKVYQGTGTTPIGAFDTLAEAFQKVNTDFGSTATPAYTITVSADDPGTGAIAVLSANTAVTLSSADASPHTLTQVQSLTRHISLTGTGKLTIQNIILNGNDSGGGINAGSAGATLTLDNGARVTNCYSGNANGGGIVAQNATLNLNAGSSVDNNRAGVDVVSGLNINGGGIWSSGGTLTLSAGAQVTTNTTTSHGGGIWSSGTTNIYGTASDNQAFRSGGGVYFAQTGSALLTVDGAQITGNMAYGYAANSQSSSYINTGGGGIMVALSSATIDVNINNSTITGNQAPSERYPDIVNGGNDYYTGYQYGGGVYVRNNNANDTNLNMSNNTISNNRAQTGAGVSLTCWGYLTNNTISGNKAVNDRNPSLSRAGAIYINSSRGTKGSVYNLYLSGGSVEGNSAYVGAGISWTNSGYRNIFVDGTAFSNQQIDPSVYMYTWDVNAPYARSSAETTYAAMYPEQITNVTQWTAPATNLYNNADIIFSANRYFTFVTNGGTFDAQALCDYMNNWYREYYYNLMGEYPTGDAYTVDEMTPYLDGFTASIQNGSNILPAPTPTKEGDVFLGWYTDQTYTTLMDDPTQMLDHHTFYALWQSMLHTVQYTDGADGDTVTNMPADSTDIPAGSEYTVGTEVPERGGYDFGGWLASTEAEESVDGQTFQPGEAFTMPDAEVTLTAQWIAHEEHVVHYAPGADDGSVSHMPSDDLHVLAGSDYAVSEIIPEREGYTFVGELAKTDATDAVEDIDGKVFKPGDHFTMPDNDVTLTMVWEVDNTPAGGGGDDGDGGNGGNDDGDGGNGGGGGNDADGGNGGGNNGGGTVIPANTTPTGGNAGKGSPKTGDDIWFALAALGLVSSGALLLETKRRNSLKPVRIEESDTK